MRKLRFIKQYNKKMYHNKKMYRRTLAMQHLLAGNSREIMGRRAYCINKFRHVVYHVRKYKE